MGIVGSGWAGMVLLRRSEDYLAPNRLTTEFYKWLELGLVGVVVNAQLYKKPLYEQFGSTKTAEGLWPLVFLALMLLVM